MSCVITVPINATAIKDKCVSTDINNLSQLLLS